MTEEVINRQSLDVDAVSGATGSSKAILKAIEVALNISI
ncbi:MAG: FMN-binding protein [Treponema sp.]|nr:FMN-binding protein [Treponema sp.]